MIRYKVSRVKKSDIVCIKIMFNFVEQLTILLSHETSIFFALVICSLSTFNGYAQTDSLETRTTSIKNGEQKPLDVDSVTIAQIKAIYDRMENLVPRFKIYKTENTYNLIKLDTATGQTWQVQYRLGDTESMTVVIDDSSLLWYSEPEIAGRFELYPTNNMFQFILIDTQTGRTWQIQWNTTPSKRFRERIY